MHSAMIAEPAGIIAGGITGLLVQSVVQEKMEKKGVSPLVAICLGAVAGGLTHYLVNNTTTTGVSVVMGDPLTPIVSTIATTPLEALTAAFLVGAFSNVG